MSLNPTPMQKAAIDTDGGVLVAAAAGSGKTAVLVERVLRKLTDPVSPTSADRLLIVTFTNAAAAEMRSRIEKRLYEECNAHPEDAGLLRQKHLISTADICTIDSFCINLVRENFEKCGVQPDFKVGDNSQSMHIRNRVLNDIITEQLSNPTKEFSTLLELCDCEYDEKNLTALIESIYDYSLQLPFPKAFISSLKKPYEEEFCRGHIWYDTAFKRAKTELDTALSLAARLSDEALYVSKNSDKCIAFAEIVASLIITLKEKCDTLDWDILSEALRSGNIPRAPSLPKEDTDEAFKQTKKEITDLLAGLIALFASREDIKAQISLLYPATVLLTELIDEFGKRLLEECKKENILTFADTEQLALSLLCEKTDGGIRLRDEAKGIAEKYDEVLVDEFQDVNDLQNMLFYVLSDNEKKLFSVGDVKQSIYGFRGSNPANFLNKKNSYIPIASAKEDELKKIILSDNFRSRAGVCKGINFFFSLLMSGQGSIVYNDEEKLSAAAAYPECSAPEVELLLCAKAEETDDGTLESEAKCIAQYICRVMKEGAVIRGSDGNLRNAEYSDFVILLSAMQGKASVVAEKLADFGIPVAYSKDAFKDTTEISVFMSLLQVIDNPRRDIQLLTVMMSPIFGFSAEEVAKIRAERKYCDLFSAVTYASQSGNQYATAFIDRLSDMRRDAAMLPLDRLISKLLDVTDYLNIVSAMPSGKTRSANLLKLSGLASQYLEASSGSISGFIRFIDSLPEKSLKSDALEDGVRIMSMHASKGLQFPVCIVANLSSKINNTDSISKILYNERLGLTYKYYDEATDDHINTLGHMLTALHTYTENIDERLRLLYVAMTRAENRLVLVSSNKDITSSLNKAAKAIGEDEHTISKRWLDKSISMNEWILACALLHPDADVLRRLCDKAVHPISHESHLCISFETSADAETVADDSELKNAKVDESLLEALMKNNSYRYPYEALLELQAKSSVSAIANSAESERFAFTERPAFMNEKGLSAAGRGTAMHKIMQFISFDGIPDIEEEIIRLEDYNFITSAEAQVADREKLSRFFESDIYRRILSSNDVRREMRFLTEIPASRLEPALEGELGNTPIIVQGAMDLCFEEDGKIVVLDFKTDRTDDPEALAETYGEQLGIYAKACEKIFGKPVKQKYIYSFALSTLIELK